MGNFPEFISKAYKKHLNESGGILIIPNPLKTRKHF
jgi:hypothetical protein